MPVMRINVFLLLAFIMCLWGLSVAYGIHIKQPVAIASEFVKPSLKEIAVIEEEVTPTKEKIYDEFAKYVKTIFGKDADTALAVSACECNKKNKAWPGCVLSTHAEHSVGAFQINLAQNKGNGAWIHASKVPGKTVAEKEEWLKDPFNNTLVAYKIFKDSGFNPWTGYTNGCYLTKLK